MIGAPFQAWSPTRVRGRRDGTRNPNPSPVSDLAPNLRNRRLAEWEFAQGATEVASTPPNLQLARWNLCNLHCVYCRDHRPGTDFPRYRVSDGRWRELLQMVPQTEVVSFFGISEFLIDPQFFELLELAGRHAATLTINTNATVCTTRHLEALGSYPGALNLVFSIDAATPEVYRRLRGADFWEVLANVRRILACRAGSRERTHSVMSFVITKTSVGDMVGGVWLAKALGVDGIRFNRLHEYDKLDWRVQAADGSTFDYREEACSRFPEEFDRQIAAVQRAAATAGIAADIPAPIGGGAAAP